MISEEATDLIQFFTGCDKTATACPAHTSRGGRWPYLTIGYDHSGPDVQPGQRITTGTARQMLARDLANVETMVRDLVRIKLHDDQFGAVCSLAFAIKPGAFQRSSVLAKLNAGDWGNFDLASAYRPDLGSLTGMARDWAEYRSIEAVDGSAVIAPQAVRRRAAELELFFNGTWTVPADLKQPQAMFDATASQAHVLRPGMRSQDISDLHEALSAAGFPVVCSDAYTWATSEAVKAFQAQHGLQADGLYGIETARKLAEVLRTHAG